MPPGSSAIAKAGRENFSFRRDATRPTTPGCQPSDGGDDDGAFVFQAKRSQRLGFRLRFGHLLDYAALGVEPIELGGDPGGFRYIAFQQQPHPEIGAADPPAGIDARSQHETEMPGFGRAVQPRHIHKRGEADVIAAPHRDQALRHEGAVEPGQRRDIGNGAERDEVQHAEQIRLGHFAAPEPARPQFPVDRDQRDQHEADRGEIAQSREIVGPVRIDQRLDLGQFVAALVMIDHDHRHPEPPRFGQRLETGGAAIHRHQQRGALAREHPDRLGVGTVAFKNAIGNMDQRVEPAMPQVPRQQRRRGCAVDIVVAEDRHLSRGTIAASAMRLAAASISVMVWGSGIILRMVGSRKSSTASISTSRPASTRASISGN